MKIAAVVILMGTGWLGCHEAVDTAPDIGTGADDVGLALSCEANLTCAHGVCDPATLRCFDCLDDGDCQSGRCHPRDRVCVQCLGPDDCDGGACHPTRAICVGCFDDRHCQRDGRRGVCHPEQLTCVQCTADSDCPSGRCNPQTSACVGPCSEDAHCADRNPCTIDRCEDGQCRYAPMPDERMAPCDDGAACTIGDRCVGGRCQGERTESCCAPLTCRPDQGPLDRDRDGCAETCACLDPPPHCPPGTTPLDRDLGGCADHCLCPSGAVIAPGGECPCALEIGCDGGLVPSDLDGDGCPETCARPCRDGCDCLSQGLVAVTPCPLSCAECGPFLACELGACVGRCGLLPERACACPPPPPCGPLESAYDSDRDGCNDACHCLIDGPDGCACPTAIACEPGASPVDTDQDGCADTCRCDDPSAVPRPDGRCCAPLMCPAGQVPADEDGDRCPDRCRCESGDDPAFAPPACPCAPLTCPSDAKPEDRDQNGCPETCTCEDGTSAGPAGCETCLSQCEADAGPAWIYYVDRDDDGCYDLTAECPVGATARASPGAGCPDLCAPCPVIACPTGARAQDGDGDRCPDRCVCADGNPAPAQGCGCANARVCLPPEAPVDLDGDGCADVCRTPCTSACECGLSALVAPCDCVDCGVARACVDGFCAAACVQIPESCLAADEPVCGCDGKSYANDCERLRAGVDRAARGACPSADPRDP